MVVVINGEQKAFEQGDLSIAQLLALSGVESVETVSVQRNGEFVDKVEFATTALVEGDEVDFLYFMGGGCR